MDAALRPMSTSQVLDRTFSLYRQNFLLFAGIAAVPPALLLLGQLGIVAAGALSSFSGRQSLQIAAVLGAVLAGIGLLGLWIVGYALATGASVYAVSRVHLGYPAGIFDSYKLISPYLGRILGLVVLVFLAIGGVLLAGVILVAVPMVLAGMAGAKTHSFAPGIAGVLAIIVAIPAVAVLGLYLSAKFSLAVPACVVEKLGVVDSIRRSWRLSEGSVLRLILVNILAGVISFGIGAVLSIPYFVGIVLFAAKKNPAVLMPFVIWQYVADFIARSIAFPIATIAVSLIYYDERVRKEAFDLQLMMEAIGRAQPAPLQGEASSGPAPTIG